MTYDKLLMDAENSGLPVNEKPLKYGLKGVYKNSKIIIDKKLKTSVEKRCILAEEIGHHETSYGNILDQSDISNRKQEKRARNWTYEKLAGIISIVNAYEKGIKNRHDLAEYLNITEIFLEEAIQHYREKYGVYYEIDTYIVYFEPSFGILKKF
ncbi:hypothetical protein ACJDU8_01455 [Clostridium sp. WILCCON 0269]|uniref:IrrE N-terminal-like domain-containing protein n=1 Tax=Candidatus Clostridium eludens TaxID=3381663 RepID=A0ABW8SEF5_9CLOT